MIFVFSEVVEEIVVVCVLCDWLLLSGIIWMLCSYLLVGCCEQECEVVYCINNVLGVIVMYFDFGMLFIDWLESDCLYCLFYEIVQQVVVCVIVVWIFLCCGQCLFGVFWFSVVWLCCVRWNCVVGVYWSVLCWLVR